MFWRWGSGRDGERRRGKGGRPGGLPSCKVVYLEGASWAAVTAADKGGSCGLSQPKERASAATAAGAYLKLLKMSTYRFFSGGAPPSPLRPAGRPFPPGGSSTYYPRRVQCRLLPSFLASEYGRNTQHTIYKTQWSTSREELGIGKKVTIGEFLSFSMYEGKKS